MVKELSLTEQQRMPVDEAGKLYNGSFIFFTNCEYASPNSSEIISAIPRVIAETAGEFFKSDIAQKYKGKPVYGPVLSCTVFMDEANIPPILAF